MNEAELRDVLEHVVPAVRATGHYIAAAAAGRSLLPGDLKVRSKSGAADYVTEVDEEAERRLVAFLRRHYPQTGVLAEEGSRVPATGGLTWVLDPLDGTRNFVRGHPGYCVSLALVSGDVPVLAVVHDVEADDLYSAFAGGGAWLNGRRLQVASESDPEHLVVGVGYPADSRSDDTQLQRYLRLLNGTAALRQGGSVARELALVARGALDAFWQPLLSPWDIAAGMLLVKEAGGRVEPLSAGPWLSAGTLGVLAASHAAFDRVQQLLQ